MSHFPHAFEKPCRQRGAVLTKQRKCTFRISQGAWFKRVSPRQSTPAPRPSRSLLSMGAWLNTWARRLYPLVLFYLFKPSGQWDETFDRCILLSRYTATNNDLINGAAQCRHCLPSEQPSGAKELRSRHHSARPGWSSATLTALLGAAAVPGLPSGAI